MTTYELTLDVFSPEVQGLLSAKYGDTARAIRFRLRENEKLWKPNDGAQVIFTALKADGTVLYNPCREEKDCYIYDFTPQTTACPGLMQCELRIYVGEQLLTSPRFDIEVTDTVYHEGDVVDSTSEAVALKTIGEDMRRLIYDIEQERDCGGFNGEKGEPGDDGITPHIGSNGNWFLGEADTGVNATGQEVWEKLSSFSISEADAVRVVAIDRDSDGNPFSCRKLCLKTYTSAPSAIKSKNFHGWICVNGNGTYNSGSMGCQVNYVNYADYARMENCFLYELNACCYNLFTSGVSRAFVTPASDFHEIELAGYGDESYVFFGEFELWGVRA